MEYPIKISKKNHYKAALSIVNCFLKLSDYELDLIVGMLNNSITVLNKENRKNLRDLLNTDVYTFNNYIKRLKAKGYLIESEEGLALISKIVEAASDKEIIIRIDVN